MSSDRKNLIFVVSFFVVMAFIVWVMTLAPVKKDVYMYTIYEHYKYTDSGKNIAVDIDADNQVVYLNYNRDHYRYAHMSSRDCQPVKRRFTLTYLCGFTQDRHDVVCGKDILVDMKNTDGIVVPYSMIYSEEADAKREADYSNWAKNIK